MKLARLLAVILLGVFLAAVPAHLAQAPKAPPPPPPQLMSNTSALPTTAFIADTTKQPRPLKDYAPGAKEIVVAYVTLKTIHYAPDKPLQPSTIDKMTIVTPLGPVGTISLPGGCDWNISISGTTLQLDPSKCSYVASGLYGHFVATVIYK